MMKILHIGVYTPEGKELGSRLFYLVRALQDISDSEHYVASLVEPSNGNGIKSVVDLPVIRELTKSSYQHFDQLRRQLRNYSLKEIDLVHMYMDDIHAFGGLGGERAFPVYGAEQPIVTSLDGITKLKGYNAKQEFDCTVWDNIEGLVRDSIKVVVPSITIRNRLIEIVGMHDKLAVVNGSDIYAFKSQSEIRKAIWDRRTKKYANLFKEIV
jgi:hypothetical protein